MLNASKEEPVIEVGSSLRRRTRGGAYPCVWPDSALRATRLYDANANATRKLLGSDVEAYFAYDRENRVSSIRWHDGATPVAYFEYSRDDKGLVKMIGRPGEELNASYHYDRSDRLIYESWGPPGWGWGQIEWGNDPWGGITYFAYDYAYDLAGNRTEAYYTYDGYWSYYEYASDDSLTKRWRADTGAGTYFEYDKTGSCEKMVSPAGVTYFEYTAANLVSRMAELGGSEFLFAYDGNQERYAIVEDGTATYYLWDGLRLLETRNADYTLKARFAHAGPPASGAVDGIGTCTEVYRASDGKRYYVLCDHRGSAHVVLDESKSVVASRLYNAYGEIISETGTWPDEVPFGYQANWLAPPGLTLPDGTQLYLTKTRVYDPRDGRFLQRDFRRTPGENAYVYARNDPVNLVDPRGLQPEEKCPWEMTNKELIKESKTLRGEIEKNPRSEAAKAAAKRLSKINKEVKKRLRDMRGRGPGEGVADKPSAEEALEAFALFMTGVKNDDALSKVPGLDLGPRVDPPPGTDEGGGPPPRPGKPELTPEEEWEMALVEAALGPGGYEFLLRFPPEVRREVIRYLQATTLRPSIEVDPRVEGGLFSIGRHGGTEMYLTMEQARNLGHISPEQYREWALDVIRRDPGRLDRLSDYLRVLAGGDLPPGRHWAAPAGKPPITTISVTGHVPQLPFGVGITRVQYEGEGHYFFKWGLGFGPPVGFSLGRGVVTSDEGDIGEKYSGVFFEPGVTLPRGLGKLGRGWLEGLRGITAGMAIGRDVTEFQVSWPPGTTGFGFYEYIYMPRPKPPTWTSREAAEFRVWEATMRRGGWGR